MIAGASFFGSLRGSAIARSNPRTGTSSNMATIETDRPGTVHGEVRMLIDGELVEAAVRQALREHQPRHRGECSVRWPTPRVDDMQRAIAAARRAFDETDWSTNRAFRKRCLEQLQAAIEGEKEALRAELVAEVGYADHPHLWRPARRSARRRPHLAGADHRHVRVGARPRRGARVRWACRAQGREGGRRRRRRDRSVELPVRGVDPEDRPGARHRQHDDPEARARHAVERDAHRSSRRRADRHPGRRLQRRVLLRPHGR